MCVAGLLATAFRTGIAAEPKIPGFYGNRQLPAIHPQALPQLQPGGTRDGADISYTEPGRMTVSQDKEKAVIDWEWFNIGESAEVTFDQQGKANWAALNRIHDGDPSQILGALKADGKIYLVNRNGILFGPDAKVDVHGLVASALHLTEKDFLEGNLHFGAGAGEEGAGREIREPVLDAVVANHGQIITDELGSVFLIAPNVENGGVIVTPLGQIGLAAGTEVSLEQDTRDRPRAERVVNVRQSPEGSAARNLASGRLNSDLGVTGLYGRIVNQEGAIKAVTGIKKNGRVELFASDKATTGKESVIESPISTSEEKEHESFRFQGGSIEVKGLDPDPQGPLLLSNKSARVIEHQGRINAPSGHVILRGEERVYLGETAEIDVSGSWVEAPASDHVITVQMNSVELKDDYGQKEGVLRGETVKINPVEGSAIGDISAHLTGREETALERSTPGGTIGVISETGDFIMREGASIDFSGGGTRFAESSIETTRLRAGERVYDISEAPEWLKYDQVLIGSDDPDLKQRYAGSETVQVSEAWMSKMPAYEQGADAGTLDIQSSRVALNGNIHGKAEAGRYQNRLQEPVNHTGRQSAGGRVRPVGGVLKIGRQPGGTDTEHDSILESVVVTDRKAMLPAVFGSDPDLHPYPVEWDGNSLLWDELLTDAGLNQLSLYPLLRFVTEPESHIHMRPGASLSVECRSIDHSGAIRIPAGNIGLSINENVTYSVERIIPEFGSSTTVISDRFTFLSDETIRLRPGSVLDVSGETAVHLSAGRHFPLPLTQVGGGKIGLLDKIDFGTGVFIQPGAGVFVDGGYRIDPGGEVTGGNAGSLMVQGNAIQLDGQIQGRSLIERAGGSLTLRAKEVVMTPADARSGIDGGDYPLSPEGRLILQADRLAGTGFSDVSLQAKEKVIVEPDTIFRVSPVKFVFPSGPVPINTDSPLALIENTFDPLQPEKSRLSLVTSVEFHEVALNNPQEIPETVEIGEGASVRVGTGGEIAIASKEYVDLAGAVTADAGTVDITANLQFRMTDSGRISVRGAVLQDEAALARGIDDAFIAYDAGEVLIRAGDARMEKGAVIDISGSPVVNHYYYDTHGRLGSLRTGGDAGTLNVEGRGGEISLDGEIRAHARDPAANGGRIRIHEILSGEDYVVTGTDMLRYLESGADALEFGSSHGLAFDFFGMEPAGVIDVGRSLTLNAPRIASVGQDDIRFKADTVTIGSTYWPLGPEETGTIGLPDLILEGRHIDLTGAVVLDRFDRVILSAGNDIRVADNRVRSEAGEQKWVGRFSAPGDLTLSAKRIFPETGSVFTLEAGKTLRTDASNSGTVPDPYSARADLTLIARDIWHGGNLLAPMGSVTLSAPEGRIWLDENSRIRIGGEPSVRYGRLDRKDWNIEDKETLNPRPVQESVDNGVRVTGREVLMDERAEIDVSAGGDIFSYQYQTGLEGTADPLKGRYVILPDNSVRGKGDTVVFRPGAGWPAGDYYLLPEEFAFQPGAMVLTDIGPLSMDGPTGTSKQGYPVVTGAYRTGGAGAAEPVARQFVLRPSESVLAEGHFNRVEYVRRAGDDLAMSGSTLLISGRIENRHAEGGVLSLMGEEIIVGTQLPDPGPDMSMEVPIPYDLEELAQLETTGVTWEGFEAIRFGEEDRTDRIFIQHDSHFGAPSIRLAAGMNGEGGGGGHADDINIQYGVTLDASNEDGEILLLSDRGKVSVGEGSRLLAGDRFHLKADRLTHLGDIMVENGNMVFEGGRIKLTPEGYRRRITDEDALLLPETLWRSQPVIGSLAFKSRSDLVLAGGQEITLGDTLEIDARRITGESFEGADRVVLNARDIRILNSSDEPASEFTGAGDGDLYLHAETMSIGGGEIRIDGFDQVHLSARDVITGLGSGALFTQRDLSLTAGVLTASALTGEEETRQASDFNVISPNGRITIEDSGAPFEGVLASGGKLSLLADSVCQNGTVDLPAGTVQLTATGESEDSGLFLGTGSSTHARGGVFIYDLGGAEPVSIARPGGSVALTALGGADLVVETGARVDVSGTEGGAIRVSAPGSEVVLEGTLAGRGFEGIGADFDLNAGAVADFSDLLLVLAEGRFEDAVSLVLHQDDIQLTETDRLTGADLRLEAPAGAVDIQGEITARKGRDGGEIFISGLHGVNLHAGGTIQAAAAEADGNGGWVRVESGGLLTLAGGVAVGAAGDGRRGDVYLRAPVTGGEIQADLSGRVIGADSVILEAVLRHRFENDLIITEDLIAGTEENSGWRQRVEDFMDLAPSREREILNELTLSGTDAEDFRIYPGLEVYSAGDLTLAADWDLTDWRYGETPGALTLAADGNLIIQKGLTDHPTPVETLPGQRRDDSWNITLRAGGGLEPRDPAESGNLRINGLVYTESGRLSLNAEAGIHVELPGGYSLPENQPVLPPPFTFSNWRYAAATFDGDIDIAAGGDVRVAKSAVQSATGNIRIDAGGDLIIGSGAAVRTTGTALLAEAVDSAMDPLLLRSQYGTYSGGGDIALTVNGRVRTAIDTAAWGASYQELIDLADLEQGFWKVDGWAARYQDKPAVGVVAMGGGGVSIDGGGDVLGQMGAFGQGDFSIRSGGNIDGRFLVADGTGDIYAENAFGLNYPDPSILELLDAQVSITAQNGIQIGTILNPTVSALQPGTGENFRWNLTYSEETAVKLISLNDDAVLTGTNKFYSPQHSDKDRWRILPGTFEIGAGRDVRFTHKFAMAPSPRGTLTLSAGRDIVGIYEGLASQNLQQAAVVMSSLNPGEVYGRQADISGKKLVLNERLEDRSGADPLHREDPVPNTITAGRDLNTFRLVSPKSARITAGRNILDLEYLGQNVSRNDLTDIHAGNDFLQATTSEKDGVPGIEVGGPGRVWIQAGSAIDLGTSKGISAVGDLYNMGLGAQGASLTVVAGTNLTPDKRYPEDFFETLRVSGVAYSSLRAGDKFDGVPEETGAATGDPMYEKAFKLVSLFLEEGETIAEMSQKEKNELAECIVAYARETGVKPFFSEADSGDGDIDMINSQINTSGRDSDLYVIARGDINVGITTFDPGSQKNATGIYTSAGGDIDIFSVGDLNVNESRVMTYFGGDITVWTDEGDINAGRGAKTAISSEPPKLVENEDGTLVIQFEPPAVGSGIRTLTFDPDGLAGPREAPQFGDVFLSAPSGEIDAGEAGISGGRVYLGATQILNAQNISFSQGGVGVPAAGDSTVTVGTFSGSSGLTEASSAGEDSVLGGAKNRAAEGEALAKAFIPSWLEVKVVGYIEDEDDDKDEDDEEEAEAE